MMVACDSAAARYDMFLALRRASFLSGLDEPKKGLDPM